MYKKNNLILVVAIFMIATTKLLAQTPDLLFEKQSPYPNLHPGTSPGSHLLVSYVLEVAPNEESNGYYLLARTDYKNSCFNYETESAFLPIIYKVSQQGELIGELPLGYENRYSYLCGVYPAPTTLSVSWRLEESTTTSSTMTRLSWPGLTVTSIYYGNAR